MTEQQLFDLFRPRVTMPPAARERQLCRVLAEVRRMPPVQAKIKRQRRRLGLRRVAVSVALLVMLAAGNASAQVECNPCNRVLLPIVHNTPGDVDAATRFWGG